MKKYLLFFVISSLFITCSSNLEAPEVISEEPPEEPSVNKPCGCCDVVPIEGYSWFHEVVWKCETPLALCLIGREPMDFCQIPDDVLNSLTTEELVEICIQYSYLYNWIFVNSKNIQYHDCSFYINDVISNFNGLIELFKREDCLYELLKRYDEITCNMSAVCKSIDLATRILIKDIELLISAYQTDDEDAVETYKEILRHLMDGYHAQQMFPEIFYPTLDLFSSNTNFIARMYMIEKISPGTLRAKVESESASAGWHWAIEWYLDISNLIPCHDCFYPDQYEGIVINELSYELIK